MQVPLEKEKRVHANLARGIAYLRVLVSKEAFEEKVKEIQAALGIPPSPSSVDSQLERAWELESPSEEGYAQ